MMTSRISAGPNVLGLDLGADATVTDDGWVVRELHAAPGLDGPAGILQGGLAVGVTVSAARLLDRFGAPLTSVTGRLHAPTPLGRDLQIRARPTDAARYEVETHDGSTLLVRSEVELAGQDPTPQAFDLLELATAPLPEPDLGPPSTFPVCWACGTHPTHPYAQRLHPGWHGTDSVITPWVADDVLGTQGGAIDPLVLAAVLDCPTVFAAWRHLQERGDAGCLLGGYHLRIFSDAPVMEPLRTVGRFDEADGRKIRSRAALLDEDGMIYALSSALQIAVPEVPTL